MKRTHGCGFTLKGFTLIEVMIVVAIIGILSAIAYPSYTASVRKGKRAQARTAILELMQQQERYMTQRNTYLFFTNSRGTTVPATVPFTTYSGDNTTSTAYWMSSSACGTATARECVTITATPTIADTEVGALSMTSTGLKTCSGTASATNFRLCWP